MPGTMKVGDEDGGIHHWLGGTNTHVSFWGCGFRWHTVGIYLKVSEGGGIGFTTVNYGGPEDNRRDPENELKAKCRIENPPFWGTLDFSYLFGDPLERCGWWRLWKRLSAKLAQC